MAWKCTRGWSTALCLQGTWLTALQTLQGGQEGDPGEDPELKGDLSEQDYAKLQELVDEQEAAIQAGESCGGPCGRPGAVCHQQDVSIQELEQCAYQPWRRGLLPQHTHLMTCCDSCLVCGQRLPRIAVHWQS